MSSDIAVVLYCGVAICQSLLDERMTVMMTMLVFWLIAATECKKTLSLTFLTTIIKYRLKAIK